MLPYFPSIEIQANLHSTLLPRWICQEITAPPHPISLSSLGLQQLCRKISLWWPSVPRKSTTAQARLSPRVLTPTFPDQFRNDSHTVEFITAFFPPKPSQWKQLLFPEVLSSLLFPVLWVMGFTSPPPSSVVLSRQFIISRVDVSAWCVSVLKCSYSLWILPSANPLLNSFCTMYFPASGYDSNTFSCFSYIKKILKR